MVHGIASCGTNAFIFSHVYNDLRHKRYKFQQNVQRRFRLRTSIKKLSFLAFYCLQTSIRKTTKLIKLLIYKCIHCL